MTDIAIHVQDLSKRYRLDGKQKVNRTIRETLTDTASAPFRYVRSLCSRSADRRSKGSETLWALDNVSFEVKKGEVIGLIGRNGAGKSTLLKILSQITEPTQGFADINGRVGSLLEVGTGFHPELSGRENIYLNGAILGMTRIEIQQRMDEIVAFAEVEKFIDMPVKHYSSGMYLRLAFAVAAHLEPEILLVDEVLAVGDAAFQKKCLGKMEGVAKEGRTVLFVSHNMSAIKSLCGRVILLEGGRVICDGSVDEVVDTYLAPETEMTTTGCIPEDAERIGTGEAKVSLVQLSTLSGGPVSQLYFGQPFRITLKFDAQTDIQNAIVEVNIGTPDGIDVILSTSIDEKQLPLTLERGTYEVQADFNIVLLPRRYSVGVGIHRPNGKTVDFIRRALDFTVLKVAQNANEHYRWDNVRGYVRGLPRWHVSKVVSDSAERIGSRVHL